MRTVLAAPLIVAIVTLLAGCGGSGGSGSPHGRADLTIQQVLRGRSLYIEGSVSYVRLSAADGNSAQRRLDNRGRAEFRKLAPGRYRLDSWQRPCDGNCGFLDDPTDRCSRRVTLQARDHVLATVILRPGHGCRIEIS